MPQPNPSASTFTNSSAHVASHSDSIYAGAKASLDPLARIIDGISKLQIPGIAITTSLFKRIIDHLRAVPDACVGWKRLVVRLERLAFMLDAISNAIKEEPEIQGRAESTCALLNYSLRKLADDMDQAKAENKIIAFFNSTDESSAIAVHDKKLNSIIGDLTLTLCAYTPLTRKDIEAAFNDMIARVQEESSKGNSDNDAAVSVKMTDNVIKTKRFRSGVGNQLIGLGRARVNVDLRGNEFVSEAADAVVEIGVNNAVAVWDTRRCSGAGTIENFDRGMVVEGVKGIELGQLLKMCRLANPRRTP